MTRWAWFTSTMPTTLSPEVLAALPADVTYVDGRFMRTSYGYQVFAGDGTDLHVYQVTAEAAHEYIETRDLFRDCGEHKEGTPYADVPGVHDRVSKRVTEANRSDAVLWGSGIAPEHWTMLRLDANRMGNTVGGQPSSNMSSACSSFKMDPVRFMEQRARDNADDRRVRDLEREHIRSGLINLDAIGR